ncbi:MAG TPA: hypothetical protein VHB50_15900, partial [Bryobacteraceae bacterium]|nr:hypothetical protein [Bryobacteraceae bacterium]
TGGCAIHWLARPHLFTQLFLVVTLHLTERAREGRTRLLAWLVPLTLLWTNVHGGFFVIFLVLGCYIASDLLNVAVGPGPFERASLRAIRPWVITFFACLAVTFVNPYGWQLHRHIVEYLRDPYQFQHISELQSINFHSPVVPYFEPLLALALAAAIRDARHRRFADALLSLGWLHLALIAQRNLPLFAIVASPMAARGISASIAWLRRSDGFAAWIGCAAAWFEQSSAGFEKTDRIGRVHLASALPLTAVAAVLLLTPPAPGAVDSKFTSTYDPKSYPEQALAPLRDPAIHHIFADDEWGDYLIYRLYPAKKVFVDGRSDFYGDAFGQRYLDLMDVLPGWQKTLDRYDVDAIVLSPRRALAAVLKISRDWRVTYDDGVSVVFRRNPREPNSLVTSDERKNRDRAITIPINGDHAITQPNT